MGNQDGSRKEVTQRLDALVVHAETTGAYPVINKTVETKTTFVRNGVKDDKATLLANVNYTIPGDEGKDVTDAANDAAFLAWLATNPTITVSGVAFGQDGGEDKVIPPTVVNCYEAFAYGVSLSANAIGRKAADLAKPITDHIITVGKATTDLDAIGDNDLARAFNKLTGDFAVDLGATNHAKINDKIRLSVEQGKVHQDQNGDYVTGPVKNGKGKK